MQVYPTCLWKQLQKRSKEKQGTCCPEWPSQSNSLCWYCCHPFTTIPCYIPYYRDIREAVFYFLGNFCTWNCAKAYAINFQGIKRKEAIHYVSLLAFLTSHRPRYCPDTTNHTGLCECVSSYSGVQLPLPREKLQAFGGTISIEVFRKDMLSINDISWVVDNFYNHKNMYAFVYSIYPCIYDDTPSQTTREKQTKKKNKKQKWVPPIEDEEPPCSLITEDDHVDILSLLTSRNP